ncbi:hypothetical protein LZC95_35090 [Pendulispora brunnea]|uniref:Uncharacterized protein n=1 Tax=Pendulispora brunnea TaxID=2905690 RepID=A0ABZ2JYU8_9BACT
MAKLLEAGYEPWLSSRDQALCRRWLSGLKQQISELRFLRELAGAPERWPKRAVSRHPMRPTRRTWCDWHATVEAARAAEIAWDDCAINVGRRAELALPASVDPRPFRLFVGALGMDDAETGRSLELYVRLFDPSGSARRVPGTVVTAVVDELRRGGYRRDRGIPGQLSATKRVPNATFAAREGARIYERITTRIRA